MSESPTPRMDAESIDISERCWGTCHDAIELARQLERELDAVEREIGRHQPELCDEIRMERDDLKKQLAAAQGELVTAHATYASLSKTKDLEVAYAMERVSAALATIKRFRTMGVCQLAAELNNPPLREYMEHWEYRAETAEAALAERERQVDALLSELASTPIGYCLQLENSLKDTHPCGSKEPSVSDCKAYWREWSLNARMCSTPPK